MLRKTITSTVTNERGSATCMNSELQNTTTDRQSSFFSLFLRIKTIVKVYLTVGFKQSTTKSILEKEGEMWFTSSIIKVKK